MMRRREFTTLLGGAAAWPFAAGAQQPAIPIVGFLHARSLADAAPQTEAFRRGLADAGYIDGQNVTIEYRWALGRYEDLPAMAAELVRMPVAVLFTGTEPATIAAKAATSNIPIVFSIGSDPVELGFVASYNRPAGNATGISMFTATLESKRLGMLRELVPHAATLGVMLNPKYAVAAAQLRDLHEAAQALGLTLRVLPASTDSEIDSVFTAIRNERIAAVLQAADPFLDTRREKVIALAAEIAVPTMYHFREFPMIGGLMSYGIDIIDVYREAAAYTARILRGTKPGEMPVTRPTKFEFVINLRTAKALALEIPPTLLARADEVIE